PGSKSTSVGIIVRSTSPFTHERDNERRNTMAGGSWHDNEMKKELTLWQQYRSSPRTRLRIHLFTDPSPSIGDDFDCTTLTEPTFAGYAAIFIDTWNDPVEVGEPGHWATSCDAVKFCRTDTGACETVYGYFLTREEDNLCAGAELAWPSG